MNADHLFQLWLTIISLALAGVGVVLWYFAQKVMDMPATYATRAELEKATDGWKEEMRGMREERKEDNRNTQAKLDKIDEAVTGIHRRIDALFQSRTP